MTNFTVKDLAEYAGASLKEVIQELTNKAPDIAWKATTPVPDELVVLFTNSVDEYKEVSASAPIGALASADGEGATIAQLQINSEAAQYALAECLGQIDMKSIITTAVTHGLSEINTYENTKAAIWEGYIQSRIESGNERTSQQAAVLKKQALQRQASISDRVSKQTRFTAAASAALQDAEAFLQRTLKGMHKPS